MNLYELLFLCLTGLLVWFWFDSLKARELGVRAARDAGEVVQVVPVRAGCLDMSSRGDVASVEALLRDRPVWL